MTAFLLLATRHLFSTTTTTTTSAATATCWVKILLFSHAFVFYLKQHNNKKTKKTTKP